MKRPRRGRPHAAGLWPALAWALLLCGGGRAAAGETAKPLQGPLPMETSCVRCHAELDDALKEPTLRAADDVHFSRGLACHDCHGGDPTAGLEGDPSAAHSAAHGWRGKPERAAIPAFCARCHADATFMKRFDPHTRVDQLSEYQTSGHGRALKAGDTQVAVCIDCHGVHGIRRVSDPQSKVHPTHLAETCARCHADRSLMQKHALPAEPYADYRKSVHAAALYDRGDLSAPTCNDCHGSHGAAPPGVSDVTAVCGSCHTREATLFRETEAKRHIDLTECIRCIMCHSNHAVLKPDDDMLGVGPQSTCTACHSQGDGEYAAAEKMHDSLQALQARLGEAHDLLERAGRAGVEVGPDRFALQSGRDHLVEARVLAHSFDLERFLKATGEGHKVADEGVGAGRRAFAELRYRRAGLGLFLVIVMAVIVGLSLQVRALGRGPSV